MEHSNFTYVFEDDRVLAFSGRSVVASASSLEELESKLANEPGDCPTCNGTGKNGADNTACPACNGTGKIRSDSKEAAGKPPWLKDEDDEEESIDEKKANVIITPNGLRGKIMGRAKDIWGDTVTVRFDNGNIRELPVTASLKFAHEEEEISADSLDSLKERFVASYDQTKAGLLARQAELTSIRDAGRHIASTNKEAAELMVQADYESKEIAEALEHIRSVEAFEPPKREWEAAHATADLGRSSSWIDSVHDEMVREAGEEDFEKLMDEGPEAFVAGLPDAVVGDVPTVRELVSSYLAPKVSMADKEIRDQYVDLFQSRVESIRRREVTARKSSATQKQAALEDNVKDAPDEALFG